MNITIAGPDPRQFTGYRALDPIHDVRNRIARTGNIARRRERDPHHRKHGYAHTDGKRYLEISQHDTPPYPKGTSPLRKRAGARYFRALKHNDGDFRTLRGFPLLPREGGSRLLEAITLGSNSCDLRSGNVIFVRHDQDQ